MGEKAGGIPCGKRIGDGPCVRCVDGMPGAGSLYASASPNHLPFAKSPFGAGARPPYARLDFTDFKLVTLRREAHRDGGGLDRRAYTAKSILVATPYC